MKQIFFLSLILLFLNTSVQGQSVDSLINILNSEKLTTDEQMELYLKICHSYYKSFNSDKNILYAKKGLALAEKENNKLKISRFNEYIGYGYSDQSIYDTAMIYQQKSLEAAIGSKDTEQIVGAKLSIAAILGMQGNYNSALEYYLKALPLSEKLGNNQKNISILFNIGSIYSAMYNYDRAIYYFEQVNAMAEQSDEFRDYFKRNVYYELGKIYKDRKEFDKALWYAQESLEFSRITQHTVYEAMNLQLMAQINYNKEPKEFDLALDYAKESVRLSEETGFHAVIIASWNILSNAYLATGSFKESEELAFKAWQHDSINLSTNINTVTTNILYNIAFCNIHLGNKEKASTFLQKYHATMLRYNEKSLHDSLIDMEIKYETEKKEMRITSLEKERYLYIWLGITGVLLAFVLAIVLRQKIKNAQKEKLLIATRSVLDGEIKERTRLAQDLHDRLSGNLSAMKLELGNQTDTLQNIRNKLDNCIRDIREAAHDIMPSSLQFGMKVALEDFAAQFPNVGFHFFGEAKRIDKRIEYVVYCCAQELVNNAIKHSAAKNINLQLVQDEKYVTMTVSDDGCGFNEKNVTKGFGLKSIRDRVASCKGKIDIFTSPGKGTETTIELSLENSC